MVGSVRRRRCCSGVGVRAVVNASASGVVFGPCTDRGFHPEWEAYKRQTGLPKNNILNSAFEQTRTSSLFRANNSVFAFAKPSEFVKTQFVSEF